MLTIRKEQMTLFSELFQSRYEKEVIGDLRKRFPEKTKPLSDGELTEYFRKQLHKARSYGVKTKRDIKRFVDASLTLGEDFDTHPKTKWAQAILNSSKLTGEEKMLRISDYLLFTLKGNAS